MSTDSFPAASSGVSFGPPSDWVSVRDRDDAFQAPSGAAESVLLIDHQLHAASGEGYRRIARRFEIPAAVQTGSQFRCDFDPATQSIKIHSIAICRGEERIEQGNEAKVRVLQREENLERLILDGTKTVVLLLEDVRVGDVLDVSYTVTSKPRMFADHLVAFLVLPTWSHTRLFHARVVFPSTLAMQWRSDAKDLPLQKRELPTGEHDWSVELSGLRPAEPEPGVPSWVLPGNYLQFSSLPDWAAVAAGVEKAWSADFDHAELRKCAEEIQKEPTTALRLERAFRWAQDELRYLSVNTELGGQIPTNPGEVLTRRFGDCKDKSFLLAHLLRLLGVPARPVLVNVNLRHRVSEFLPSPNLFNHAIVEFEHDGQRRWIDATISFQGGGPLRRMIPSFGFGLPIGPGVTALEPITLPPKVQNRYEVREILRIEGREALHITTIIRATGRFADDLRYRHAFEGAMQSGREREQLYQSLVSNTKRASEPEVQDHREENEFTVAETFTMARMVNALDGGRAGAIPFAAHVVQRFIAFADTEKRKAPLALPEPCYIEQRIDCEFPTLMQTGTQVVSFATAEFSFDGKCRQAGDRTNYVFSLHVKRDHVESQHFATYRRRALESLGATRLAIYVPPDVRSMGRRRLPGALVPPLRQPMKPVENPEPTVIAVAPVLMSPVMTPEMREAGSTAPLRPRIEPSDNAPVRRQRGVHGVSRRTVPARMVPIGLIAFFGVILIRILIRLLASSH